MRFTFEDDAAGTCLSPIEQATCAAPTFAPYSGAAVFDCTPVDNELICTFSPALENGRTYRFNVAGGSAKIRGLVGDVYPDGAVNALDRSIVVGVWTGSGFTCPTDVDNSGATNAVDRGIVVGAWTGTNCAPCPQGISGKAVARSPGSTWSSGTPRTRLPSKPPIRTPHPFNRRRPAIGGRWERAAAWIKAVREGFAAKSGSDDGVAEGAWTIVSGTASLEVQPIGGGVPADTLVVGERYEIGYFGASHPVEAYALLVSSSTYTAQPITAVESADSTGLFEFSVIEEDPTEEDAQGLVRCGMALDDQAGSDWLGGPEGSLCSFTAAQSGTLILDLWLSWVDEAGQTSYESHATETYSIGD